MSERQECEQEVRNDYLYRTSLDLKIVSCADFKPSVAEEGSLGAIRPGAYTPILVRISERYWAS